MQCDKIKNTTESSGECINTSTRTQPGIQLPANAELVPREDRGFPDEVLRMYPPFPLLHRLLVTLLQRLGDTDDMLPLVVLEQLEGCASANQNKHQVIRYRKFVLTYS